jgi:conjugative relaxase-like TrwC/TraI family protein
MMTMSKALAAGQAKDYYQKEYANANENYYTESREVRGEWAGRLAEEWGLAGPVESGQYERLCMGQDPHTGEQLIRAVRSRESANRYGDEITTSEHRAGWDATFSAPKSVSLSALVGDDDRIKDAHKESVDAALEALEEYTQARGGGNHPAVTTGKMVAAKFEHTAARPDRATGYAAPQLHTHVVIFNVTEDPEGKARSIQPLELYRSQQYATAVYRANLAEKLQSLGYEIEVDGRTGAPEIKGFSKEYLRESSPRREELRKEAREMKERLESEGVTVKEGAGLNQAAARADRASKRYDRAEMRERALAMDAKYGHEARRAVEQALERGAVIRPEQEVALRAREAVTFARDNAMEREAVADMRKVTVDALRRNMALTTYRAVQSELAARRERGEFVAVERERRPRETTTDRMLRLERENIQRVLDGRGRLTPTMEEGQARQAVERIAGERGVTLNEGQQTAVRQLLTTNDQITGLQGGAGTGKTTVLATLREAVESAGYEVRGFAPTTRAAQLLAESGIETRTLQKFLQQRAPEHAGDVKRLFVLDESSLASTKNLHSFFARLGPQDRVLLVGDTRQHQAVEAGSPFEQLQRHGMETARLKEIVRQRDPELRQAVEKLSAGQVREAVEQLHAGGRVIEIPDDRKRLQEIAADYCRRPEGALVISPANQERVTLNNLIHEKLKAEGRVSRQDHITEVYTSRQNMTGTERTFANSYVPDEDVIRYNRASRVYGVKVGDYGRVTTTDHGQNTITVQMEDGREITYNPARLSGVSVYREAERAFSEGDRIQFRAPLAERRIANGELGTIEKIDGEKFTVALDGGKSVGFDAGKFRHLDHGYAVTSYSSQGQTVERVLVNADTRESELLLNQRTGYVALSRGREGATIYTNSQEELGEALDRRVDKEMALEATGRAGNEQARSGLDNKRQGVNNSLSRDPKVNNLGYGQGLGAEAGGGELAAGQEIALDLLL